MDNKLSVRIIKFIEGYNDKLLTNDETKQLIVFIDQNYKFVKDKRDVVQVAELAMEFIDSTLKKDFEKESKSTIKKDSEKKEYLINQDLHLKSFLGLNTFDRFISEINPKAKRKHAYMCLDSRYARFNQECTRLTWEFTNNLNVINNSTNVTGTVRDITWIRMHSMVVRKFDSIPKRATILIEELDAQAFIMPSGRRFHFVGLLNDLQNPINFGLRNAVAIGTGVPDFTIFDKYELLAGFKFNEGYYRFNKPITTLNEITISIGNPDTLVVLPKYEFKSVTVAAATPADIDFEFNEPHYYISPNSAYPFAAGTWYSIFVDGFDSPNTVLNDYLNNKEHTLISILSPTSIRITFADAPAGFHNPFPPGGFIVLPPPFAPATVRAIRFNSYRIIMNFELEYISQ